jgi:hypothetical protein
MPRHEKALPRTLDDLPGLRAARWVREWTSGQYDCFGPASQREQQDRFIGRHQLLDSGLVFEVAHSGTTVWRSPVMPTMIDAAQAGEFDVLLAGYLTDGSAISDARSSCSRIGSTRPAWRW